jgi:hypothetical protein
MRDGYAVLHDYYPGLSIVGGRRVPYFTRLWVEFRNVLITK